MSDANSVITLYRRKSLCRITSGAITSIPKITHIAFGRGGVDENGEPIAPSEDQQNLKDYIEKFPIDSVTYPDSDDDNNGGGGNVSTFIQTTTPPEETAPGGTTARYTVTLSQDQLNGEKISEAALVDAEGNLCAIKNMYAKGKDAGVTFTFTFDDKY